MNRILSLFFRSDSKIPLIPSPGRPNAVSTPQESNFSTITSPVVLAITHLLDLGPSLTIGCFSAKGIVAPPGPGDDREMGRNGVGRFPMGRAGRRDLPPGPAGGDHARQCVFRTGPQALQPRTSVRPVEPGGSGSRPRLVRGEPRARG